MNEKIKQIKEYMNFYFSKERMDAIGKAIEKIKNIQIVGDEYEWLINDKEDNDYNLSISRFIELALYTPEVQKILIEKIKEIWIEINK